MDINTPIIDSITFETQDMSIQLDILRLDLIHPDVSGNKWYKLKHNIATIQSQDYKGLITFGGAYSNHLTATAAACKIFNVPCIGIVRGDELHETSNASLKFCHEQGMQLVFVSRKEYDLKYQELYWEVWRRQYPDYFIVPEGGNNDLGRKGTEEIAQLIPSGYDIVACSVGTGTTLNGILNAINDTVQVYGFVPMKNGRYLAENISTEHNHWSLVDNYHFGGFGKYNEALISFMNVFYEQTHIPLDVVYTAKMFYGLLDMIKAAHIGSDKKILAVHTGGLQGNSTIKDALIF